ncbi:MAG: PepSY-associated TM helix domain-containing protein [Acidobacteriota bacterium]
MKSFRNTLFWVHLICGLAAGIVIFIMCVTGAALAFEKDILEFAERDVRTIRPSAGADRMPISAILGAVKEVRPDSKPTSIAIADDVNAALTIALGREGSVYADPYTGTVREASSSSVRSFFRTMTDLHRYIAMSGDGRAVGKGLTGAANMIFLFLALSGLYIWWPKSLEWRRLRPLLWFRRGAKGKARDFNWHTTIGFWCSAVLVVLTLTATVISYQWAGNLIYKLTGNPPPPAAGPPSAPAAETQHELPANIDTLWETAQNHTQDWKSISMRLPAGKDAVFTIDEGTSWNIFGRSSLTLDTASGQVAKWEPYSEQNSGRQLRTWIRFTHTGETGGWLGKLIAFAACVGGAFLVYTGFSLALRRFANWKTRRQTAA